jgi:DNA-binding response OmpR family regulator
MELYEHLRNLKILLVEDDPWIRDSLVRFLRDKGCHVVALGGVPTGLFVLDTNRFDVVICDHGPPRLDGLAYLALARRTLPDAILILLTGDRAEAARPEAERAGIDEVIGKPFTVESMERSFERALQHINGTGRRIPLSG